MEGEKKLGIWCTKTGEGGRLPHSWTTVDLGRSLALASVGKGPFFGWREGSSMGLNSSPKLCLEEYSDSVFFPQVCFYCRFCGAKGFLSHNQEFLKSFSSLVSGNQLGVCAPLLHFPRQASRTIKIFGLSLWANLPYILVTSARWSLFSRALSD